MKYRKNRRTGDSISEIGIIIFLQEYYYDCDF